MRRSSARRRRDSGVPGAAPRDVVPDGLVGPVGQAVQFVVHTEQLIYQFTGSKGTQAVK